MITTTQVSDPHPFSHLGPAPYRFGGMGVLPGVDLLEKNPMAYNSAMSELHRQLNVREGMGSCSHCGRPIKFVYVVVCADGSRWGVGCSCIENINPETVSDRKLVDDAKKAKAKQAKVKRHQTVDSGEAWITEHVEELRAVPHPKINGLTMVDYLNWMFERAGVVGKTRAIRLAKKALES